MARRDPRKVRGGYLFNDLVPNLSVVSKALLDGGPLDHRIRGIAHEVGTDDIDNADIAIMRIGAVGVERASMITVLELVEQGLQRENQGRRESRNPGLDGVRDNRCCDPLTFVRS